MPLLTWKSLRARLACYSALVIFLAATIVAVGTTWHVWLEQVENLDLALKREAKVTAHLLVKAPTLASARTLLEIESASQMDRRTLRIWDERGKLILSTGNHKVLQTLPVRPRDSSLPEFTNLIAGERELRVGTFREAGFQLEVGADLAHINDTINDLLPVYAVVLPLLLLLTLGGGMWLAGRALEPIGELAREAETITAAHLDRQLSIASPDDEIGRLSTVLNAMLDRLRVSFAQSRRFSADASHELKTPLTILRGQLEATLYGSKTQEAWQSSLASSLEEVDRLARIIDGLLLLSQSDAGQFEMTLAAMDSSAFLTSLLEDAELLAAPHDLKLRSEIEPDLWIAGNAVHLRQIVLNLFDNACKYNIPHGELAVTLRARDARVILTVANTGPPISRALADRLFERFYRGDAAHGRRVDGLGLGLAIAREIARAHQGELQLAPAEAGWIAFELNLAKIARSDAPSDS